MTASLITPEHVKQAKSLLAEMSLDQKIGQMIQTERSSCTPKQVKKHHIGSVLCGAGSFPGENSQSDWLKMSDEYWYASRGKDGKGIPIIYGSDAIHGHCNLKSATIFPHNIGLGATGDPQLAHDIAVATAKELLATGVDWSFAPNLAVAQDIRWGRFYESVSENPSLVASYASALVSGFQKPQQGQLLAACAKHFVGDGGTYHGIDQGDTRLPREDLENTHIAPFVEAINANVLTVMAAFSSWNGEKCHGSRELITNTLKGQLGFKGFVVSDMEAIDFLSSDYYQSVGIAVNAGLDMFMLPEHWKPFSEYLHEHIRLGTVPISRIDDAVTRILSVKLAIGLFELPKPSDRHLAKTVEIGNEQHQQLALTAVHKSQVLLKNQNTTLPLSKDARVLVCGKNAHNIGHQCGGFTVDWQGFSGNEELTHASSIFQGIQQHSSDCKKLTDKEVSTANPSDYDVAVVVIGEKPYAEGMGDIRDNKNSIIETGSMISGSLNVTEPYGVAYNLSSLHPEDLKLIKTLKAKDLPVVTLLVSGRPLLINEELAASDAFVACWLPGSQGKGVADVLFGDQPFSGKLRFTWPKAVLPDVDNHQTEYDPLFPIGYGLSTQKAGTQ